MKIGTHYHLWESGPIACWHTKIIAWKPHFPVNYHKLIILIFTIPTLQRRNSQFTIHNTLIFTIHNNYKLLITFIILILNKISINLHTHCLGRIYPGNVCISNSANKWSPICDSTGSLTTLLRRNLASTVPANNDC